VSAKEGKVKKKNLQTKRDNSTACARKDGEAHERVSWRECESVCFVYVWVCVFVYVRACACVCGACVFVKKCV